MFYLGIQHLCPSCDKKMEFIFFVKEFHCNVCEIMYSYNTKRIGIANNKELIFDTLYTGTFEECCRAYKMKAFL